MNLEYEKCGQPYPKIQTLSKTTQEGLLATTPSCRVERASDMPNSQIQYDVNRFTGLAPLRRVSLVSPDDAFRLGALTRLA